VSALGAHGTFSMIRPASIPPAVKAVTEYHARTIHHPDRYARALGYLDWDTQPSPFRRFAGARLFALDRGASGRELPYAALFAPVEITPSRLDRSSLSQLFYDSLALSAWKTVGATRWSLRVNPSSGNLHPTEGYLISGPIDELTNQAGVFHYAPEDHSLEQRFVLSLEQWASLGRDLPDGAFLVGLSSIYWRESWKYGERAFRYCQHDVGHAIAAIAIGARVLGWRACLLERPLDTSVAAVLGIDRQSGVEAERPDCLIAVWPGDSTQESRFAQDWDVPADVLQALAGQEPAGAPNRLSRGHQDWSVIERAAQAASKIRPPGAGFWHPPIAAAALGSVDYAGLSARGIIRQRRSALAMDGETELVCGTFYRMLECLLPERNPVVFDALPWPPCVHIALFVHRVRGLAPGLYLLARANDATQPLRAATASAWLWQRPDSCPPELALYLLHEADFRDTARGVSCHQAIASDGAFSLGMLADFAPLSEHGAWFYKRLFWETGVIGQVLYLEAEAAGVRATGIGCFFDDLMHQILGLRDTRFRSLYHFAVGGAVEDPRLGTEPAYAQRRT